MPKEGRIYFQQVSNMSKQIPVLLERSKKIEGVLSAVIMSRRYQFLTISLTFRNRTAIVARPPFHPSPAASPPNKPIQS